MREKQPYIILTFRSTTDAMAMERKCREAGIPGRLIPLPRQIGASCGLSWRISPEDYEEYQVSIFECGVQPEGEYRLEL